MAKVELWCGVYGEGSVFSVKIARDVKVSALQEKIAGVLSTEHHAVPPKLLALYLARKKEGKWLKDGRHVKDFLRGGVSTEYDEMFPWWKLTDEKLLGPNSSLEKERFTQGVQYVTLPAALLKKTSREFFMPSWKQDDYLAAIADQAFYDKIKSKLDATSATDVNEDDDFEEDWSFALPVVFAALVDRELPSLPSNRFLPKIKAGPLLLEVGQPPEWKPFEVVLAGASSGDLGLYYYPHKDAASPMGCIQLQNAHIDSLEEVLMVVTKDKTWFLCADHVRDASDWSDAICSAIERDVRRTRGEMPFFRDAVVQCLMIRVLYVYSTTHSEISYNQGMGELLATLVYLLHIEQWPIEDDDIEEVVAGECDMESEGQVAGSYFLPASSPEKEQAEATSTEEEEPTYVYVESFINIQNDDSFLDRDTFLRLAPFAGGSGKYYECCRDAAGEIVRDLTASEFIEHDAYLLLEEMMLRMAGTYCPHAPIPRRKSKSQADKPLSSADQLPVSPLDDQMNRIHHHILSRCDPPTARHLAKLGVEPQIFLLRWVRVLMAREFETPLVWQIWDAIFSLTPSDFSFINLLCVAIVREFREEILAAEDATNVLLSLRDISGRIEPARLVDNARELYDALLIAAAVEASMGSA
eukprot:jgi/Phyca11/533605/estExt2_fgenesh1_pg.C_PHYCAscaffold_150095